MQAQLKNILILFKPISLQEMDSVKLMNRTDTKFIFPTYLLPEILHKMVKHYKILEINNERIHKYNNQYFDTLNFDMYHCHHNGRPNRYKIRLRKYISSNISFLEVKHKTNTGRTIKNRMRERFNMDIKSHSNPFIEAYSPYHANELRTVLNNSFYRITFVNKKSIERLTIDFGLTYQTVPKNGTKPVELPNLTICEVKQEGTNNASPIIQILKKHNIRKRSMSKYCIGSAYLYSNLKYNRFKPGLMYINNIHN